MLIFATDNGRASLGLFVGLILVIKASRSSKESQNEAREQTSTKKCKESNKKELNQQRNKTSKRWIKKLQASKLKSITAWHNQVLQSKDNREREWRKAEMTSSFKIFWVWLHESFRNRERNKWRPFERQKQLSCLCFPSSHTLSRSVLLHVVCFLVFVAGLNVDLLLLFTSCTVFLLLFSFPLPALFCLLLLLLLLVFLMFPYRFLVLIRFSLTAVPFVCCSLSAAWVCVCQWLALPFLLLPFLSLLFDLELHRCVAAFSIVVLYSSFKQSRDYCWHHPFSWQFTFVSVLQQMIKRSLAQASSSGRNMQDYSLPTDKEGEKSLRETTREKQERTMEREGSGVLCSKTCPKKNKKASSAL